LLIGEADRVLCSLRQPLTPHLVLAVSPITIITLIEILLVVGLGSFSSPRTARLNTTKGKDPSRERKSESMQITRKTRNQGKNNPEN
jgi:hypothetical protein